MPRNIFQLHNDFKKENALKKKNRSDLGLSGCHCHLWFSVILLCLQKHRFLIKNLTSPWFTLWLHHIIWKCRMRILLSSKIQTIYLISFYLFHMLMYCLYMTCLLKIFLPEFEREDKEKRFFFLLKLVLLLCFFIHRHSEFSSSFSGYFKNYYNYFARIFQICICSAIFCNV